MQPDYRVYEAAEKGRASALYDYVLNFVDEIEGIDERFRGKFLKDHQGEYVLQPLTDENGQVITNQATQEPYYVRVRVGKPFIIDQDGEFCAVACDSIMSWMQSFLTHHSALGHLDRENINKIMLNFCHSFAEYLARNQNRWNLDKSCMKAVYDTLKSKTHMLLSRSYDGREWKNLTTTSRIQETVSLAEREKKRLRTEDYG